MIETLRNVARHFNVLYLIAPDRHLVRLEHQDVGGHQHRVHKQTRADLGIGLLLCGGVLIDRRLVGMRAIEQTFGGDAGQQPGQLRDLRDIGLPVKGDTLGVQP